MPDPAAARWVELLLQSSVLKTTPRTGWALRGVPGCESVADHVYGTAFLALVLAELHPGPVDRERMLTMALLHDLPESVVSDIPRRGARLLPEGAKAAAESAALDAILAGLPVAERWRELMEEYKAAATVEARLIKAADRLEFLLQAHVYRESTGTRRLEDILADVASSLPPTVDGEPPDRDPVQRLLAAITERWA